MDVSLTPELERRVMEKVQAGLYGSPSEVVREGLRLLFAAEEARDMQPGELDAAIQQGIDQLERGEGIEGQASRSRVLARFTTGA